MKPLPFFSSPWQVQDPIQGAIEVAELTVEVGLQSTLCMIHSQQLGHAAVLMLKDRWSTNHVLQEKSRVRLAGTNEDLDMEDGKVDNNKVDVSKADRTKVDYNKMSTLCVWYTVNNLTMQESGRAAVLMLKDNWSTNNVLQENSRIRLASSKEDVDTEDRGKVDDNKKDVNM